MSRELAAHFASLVAGLGRMHTRPMFGGQGFYCDGAFFAFVLKDVLYLKADDKSRSRFLEAGLKPFVWNKRPSLNYYRAPAEALESPAEAMDWAREALAAALRARKKKR